MHAFSALRCVLLLITLVGFNQGKYYKIQCKSVNACVSEMGQLGLRNKTNLNYNWSTRKGVVKWLQYGLYYRSQKSSESKINSIQAKKYFLSFSGNHFYNNLFYVYPLTENGVVSDVLLQRKKCMRKNWEMNGSKPDLRIVKKRINDEGYQEWLRISRNLEISYLILFSSQSFTHPLRVTVNCFLVVLWMCVCCTVSVFAYVCVCVCVCLCALIYFVD